MLLVVQIVGIFLAVWLLVIMLLSFRCIISPYERTSERAILHSHHYRKHSSSFNLTQIASLTQRYLILYQTSLYVNQSGFSY